LLKRVEKTGIVENIWANIWAFVACLNI